MFKTVLVANRGEIACRIIRTAKALGMRAIAVHSSADRDALHVKAADLSVEIGLAPSSESYLRQDRIIEAALDNGAEAIHPGCGFLAENAEFAESCTKAGLIFIGPSPEAIRAMGEKDRAKQIAIDIGIPTVPGYFGEAQDDNIFLSEAEKIGYPVLLKAVAGGGGKGLKAVESAGDLSEIAASARREAQAAFGDGRLMIEKLVEPARHIEVQIFGDGCGGAVHLFERECTLQRRNQKVIEEAPAIEMPQDLRAKMTDAALKAARAVNYAGAGTVEFILPGGPLTDDTPFYFMEMNTRLQIEHPVTELITGQDLVEWQFRIAAGEGLPLAQSDIQATGAAIEARLYAEDPATGFLPSPGRVWHAEFPSGTGIRIDTGIETGSEVPPYYDAMIAKVIGFGSDRGVAYDKLMLALEKTIIAGPKSNLAFLHRLAKRSQEQGAALSTKYIESDLPALTLAVDSEADINAELATIALLQEQECQAKRLREAVSDEPRGPWDIADSFEFSGPRCLTYAVDVDGNEHEIAVEWKQEGPRLANNSTGLMPDCRTIPIENGVIVWRDMQQVTARFSQRTRGAGRNAAGGDLRAPMFGRLTKLFVSEGDEVVAGDRVAIVEAMKMEHIIHAEVAGLIDALPYNEGDQVDSGAAIAVVVSVKDTT